MLRSTGIFLFLILLPALSYADVTVTGFRTADRERSSRFVLELSAKPDYKVFTLENPSRAVIDIPGGHWDDSLPPHSETNRVKGVRYSMKEKTLRIVLDVSSPMTIWHRFILEPSAENKNYRLVIDLLPVSASEDKLTTPKPISKSGDTVTAPTPTPKAPPPRKPLIVIDAGHGGNDPGAFGTQGTREKDITLQYARKLRKALLETDRYEVAMTRNKDVYIPLPERVSKAQKADGDLFISLHANTHADPSMEGLSVYTLSETASDKEAEALASKENKAGLLPGINLAHQEGELAELFIDMAQRDTNNLSASLAESIIEKIQHPIKLLRNPHRFAGFRVLKGVDIPSVLVELGYLTNRKEERLLRSGKYQEQITQALVESIDAHFEEYKIE